MRGRWLVAMVTKALALVLAVVAATAKSHATKCNQEIERVNGENAHNTLLL